MIIKLILPKQAHSVGGEHKKATLNSILDFRVRHPEARTQNREAETLDLDVPL